jgi:hypothetical protein
VNDDCLGRIRPWCKFSHADGEISKATANKAPAEWSYLATSRDRSSQPSPRYTGSRSRPSMSSL